MTMSATSVLPSPLLRHYPARKPAPQDLAMSRAAKPSEYRCREKRYVVLRAWRLSPHLLCPSALCCTTVFFTAVLPVRKLAPQDLAMGRAAKPSEYRRSLLICFGPRLCVAVLCFNLPRAVLLLGPVHNCLRVVLDFPFPDIHSLAVPSPSGAMHLSLALPLLSRAPTLSWLSRLAMSTSIYITYQPMAVKRKF